ncbi:MULTISPECIES: ABC transporter permease [Micromonospora]|uniref:ABC-type nitrate/sulfonate/bicarbonate transport system, permease component n=1 Tax=Micromonospora yangpuensis TaxID=683228 RepID=A0A1C6UR25_9ACTN|nr:ABC transporter permease subunit [Micromonospora yangpuensis]GGM07273.1 nitrate ABC transporter permease [Micromonospora yangpuensis]SCL56456.1 ABC-type nitrate/sulfonate/bicarbonate transport system, permease component [Micromonospora yangpuensis]
MSAARADRLRGLLGAAGLAVAFEVVPRAGLVSGEHLPPLSTVVAALAERAGGPQLWRTVGATVAGWSLGLLLAVVAAVAVGLVVGSIDVLRAATASTIDFLRPIPSVVFIPLVVLLAGAGLGATLFLVGYACFWLVLIQVLYGVRDVDPVARDAARSAGLGRLAQLRHLVWPTVLPYLVTGLRLAASVALVLTVTAGLVIGSPGLGREIWLAQAGADIPGMYGLILVTGVLGVGVNALVRLAERRLLHWHVSVRREVATG